MAKSDNKLFKSVGTCFYHAIHPITTRQDYQGISNMTQIDGEIHTNVEMNQWVANAENLIEDSDLHNEAIDDGICDEQVDTQ